MSQAILSGLAIRESRQKAMLCGFSCTPEVLPVILEFPPSDLMIPQLVFVFC
jgi:hypothetical protein